MPDAMPGAPRLVLAAGRAIEGYLDALAELRIAVFREYPYLYQGDRAYEQRYLTSYAATDAGLIVLALDGDRVVGASTALPLAQHSDEVVPPLEEAGYPAASVYYLGESVLEPAYRGRGLGRAFFEHRERRARELGFALGALDAPGWVVAELDLGALEHVRRDGQVLGHRDWDHDAHLAGGVAHAALAGPGAVVG